jgi:hypothetical protein
MQKTFFIWLGVGTKMCSAASELVDYVTYVTYVTYIMLCCAGPLTHGRRSAASALRQCLVSVVQLVNADFLTLVKKLWCSSGWTTTIEPTILRLADGSSRRRLPDSLSNSAASVHKGCWWTQTKTLEPNSRQTALVDYVLTVRTLRTLCTFHYVTLCRLPDLLSP